MPRKRMSGVQRQEPSSRHTVRLLDIELAPIPIKRSCAMPEPHHSSFADGFCPPWILLDEGTEHLAIPGFRVLRIQDGMDREIMPLPGRHAKAPQPFVHMGRSGWRRHLDDPERAH